MERSFCFFRISVHFITFQNPEDYLKLSGGLDGVYFWHCRPPLAKVYSAQMGIHFSFRHRRWSCFLLQYPTPTANNNLFSFHSEISASNKNPPVYAVDFSFLALPKPMFLLVIVTFRVSTLHSVGWVELNWVEFWVSFFPGSFWLSSFHIFT